MTRLAWLVLLPLPALAQSEGPEAPPPSPRYAQRTEIEFDTLPIDALLVGPSIQVLTEPPRLDFNPLIELRRHFQPEMEASLDEVR